MLKKIKALILANGDWACTWCGQQNSRLSTQCVTCGAPRG